jgi:hypothetical protein
LQINGETLHPIMELKDMGKQVSVAYAVGHVKGTAGTDSPDVPTWSARAKGSFTQTKETESLTGRQ